MAKQIEESPMQRDDMGNQIVSVEATKCNADSSLPSAEEIACQPFGSEFSYTGESFAHAPSLSARRSRKTTCPICGCEGTRGFRCDDCSEAQAQAEADTRSKCLTFCGEAQPHEGCENCKQ